MQQRLQQERFPEGFAFGAGASAYQWEGAANEDGRKPSVWDTFVHSRNQSNGDIACDGYHKYKEDVQLMVETGLNAYRFSISWSRLIPNGRGHVNPKGLQFYKNFIQQLVNHGIEPHVTLYHDDHPQYLEDEYGGWLNRRMIKDFTAYADVCFREFGAMSNFGQRSTKLTYSPLEVTMGSTPPGRCSPPGCSSGNSSTEPYIVGHNLLLAHASVSRLYKQKYKDIQGGSVGFSVHTLGFTLLQAPRMMNSLYKEPKLSSLAGEMLGPLTFGDYPDEMKTAVGSRLPVFSEEESEQVKGSSDFIGIMQYLAASVTNMKSKPSHPDFDSDMGEKYDVNPWAMEAVLDHIKQSYGNPPLYILENGTPMKQDLQDTPRIEYLQAYIGAVLKSIRNGSNTRGYFVWSFMDLFELLTGYDYSFGLYYVNFSDPHRKRSPKLSAHWYSAFLKGNTAFLVPKASPNCKQLLFFLLVMLHLIYCDGSFLVKRFSSVR
ncbi:unnamed protein product [Microthlaspi erraticum]|uniref:beta-glucosidase n=1 Tax=Microthlaspi erraticum TaxID=1685480 RepID=A0A6D2KNK0_9BRAS|nr:unnamed protein product [Microthlaspi erraticum]